MAIQHRVVCAVPICNSDLQWESDTVDKDISNLYIRENGWVLDFGQWVCPNHTESQIPAVAMHSTNQDIKGVRGIFGNDII